MASNLRIRARLLAAGVVAAAGLLLAGACAPRPPEPPARNVLLIVIDTFGAEHAGWMQPGLGHTPNLDRLAGSGVSFDRAYSVAPWTQPAVASMLTSRMPSEHGLLRLFDGLPAAEQTLPELLSGRGFATAGVVSHFLLDEKYGFGQGFASFDASPAGGHDDATSHLVSDAAVAELERLAAGEEPFFLFVHYFDPHFVYLHHPEHDLTAGYQGPLRAGMGIWELRDARSSLTADDIAFLVGLYREEIAYVDEHLGRLLDRLAELGLEESTLTVAVSDHGEEFMRHGWIGHTRTLYDELLHVPMVVSLPGTLPPGRVDAAVSVLDILPTILDLTGEAGAAPSWRGVSLRPLLVGGQDPAPARDLYAEVSFAARPEDPERILEKTAFKTALLRPERKLIHDLLAESWELYEPSADPEELVNLSGTHSGEEALRQRLRQWEETRPSAQASPGLAPSTDEVDRLRALGYLQ